MSELKDWLNSINFNKEDLSYDIKDYPPYVINRCLSGFIDTIMYANEMNRYHNLDKDRFKDWNATEIDLTNTMRSVRDYMREQKERKEH